MALPRPVITTTNFKNKGFLCYICKERKPVVTREANGDACDDCLPEDRRSLVSLAPDES